MAIYKVTIEKATSNGNGGAFWALLFMGVFFAVWAPFWFAFKQLCFLFNTVKIKCTVEAKLIRAYLKTVLYFEKHPKDPGDLEPSVVPFMWTSEYKKQVDAIQKKYSYAGKTVVQSKIQELRDEQEPPKPLLRYRYENLALGECYYFSLDEKGILTCRIKEFLTDGYDWEEDLR
ncbi:MAG: hypothetical protein IJ012_05360, partial [Clostridia bacterium]|nr:hypothetical protein [Clostridia bacterium]